VFEVKKTVSKENSSGGSSYGQILKSSSIIGGAQAINYIIGLVRIKFVAVLLGPSGVGLVGLYVSAIGLVQTFAQFGINESGVREVAAAVGSKDEKRVAQTVKALRRVCWFTGIFGWILTVVLAWPLSQWVLGSADHMWAIAILGIVVFLELLSGGQKAVLQGVRRVGDLARMKIVFALLSTILAVGIYWWLGEEGIVPVIILTSFAQIGASWWFARQITVVPVSQTWPATWQNAKALLRLGSAFMYGGLLAAGVGLVMRSLIVRELGLDAAGFYQAAWALSGMFGLFVLQAMGTDFYPRLTAVALNDAEVTKLVNEQMQVGMLMTLPGVLATIIFAPWLIALFYSQEFLSGAALLPWFAAGVFVQVVTWPIGMIQRAKGASAWIAASQTHLNLLNLALGVVGLQFFGLVAVAWAFVVAGIIHGFFVHFIASRLARYRMSGSCLATIGLSALAIALCSILGATLPVVAGMVVNLIVLIFASLLCMRALLKEVGTGSRLASIFKKIPGSWLLLP